MRNVKRIVAVALLVVMISALAVTIVAMEARYPVLACPDCIEGDVIYSYSPINIHYEPAFCSHGGKGMDLMKIEEQTTYRDCNKCSYHTETTEKTVTLVSCPTWK